jgi:hypothetical protein
MLFSRRFDEIQPGLRRALASGIVRIGHQRLRFR